MIRNNTIIFLNEYPTEKNRQDGYFRRVEFIDTLFKNSLHIYLNISNDITEVGGHQISENIYQLNMLETDYSHPLLQIININQCIIYAHSIYRLESPLAVDIFRRGELSILDVHGCVPEEEAYKGVRPKEEIDYFHTLEKVAIVEADYIICVSNNMQQHLEKKYDNVIKNTQFIQLPIIGIEGQYSPHHQNENKPTVIYSGGVQHWQQIEKMLHFVHNFQDQLQFVFLVHDTSHIADSYKTLYDAKFPGDLHSVNPEEVSDYYQKANYGLILREDNLVNHIASPTKLSEYLCFGIVPIVDNSNIGDFENLNYKSINYRSFKPLDRKRYLDYTQHNRQIYEKILTTIHNNKQKLSVLTNSETQYNLLTKEKILSSLITYTNDYNSKLKGMSEKYIQLERYYQELQTQIQSMNMQLHDKDIHIVNVESLAQSLRIKNRIKRILKMLVPKIG